MAGLVTHGLVIRRADYADYDRMITLFTPQHGRIDAIVRGCKRPKSPLMNAAEPFCAGEYQLYHSKDRYSVSQCQITDSFYNIREDYVHDCAAGAGVSELFRSAARNADHGI